MKRMFSKAVSAGIAKPAVSTPGAASVYSGVSNPASTAVSAGRLIADLRSDTVTVPTVEMRNAMANALVGDDVYVEDPTVIDLENLVASISGHQAAIFCASGTMTNQLGIRSLLHSPPYSIVADARSHIYCYEASGVAHHSQALIIPVSPENGVSHLTADAIAKHFIIDDDVHHAPTKVICLENTLAGEIFPYAELVKIRKLATDHNIKLHLDGARLWNASAATGVSIKEYCSLFDTVSLCLSKGLGAPVGSVLVSDPATIKRARHYRKIFGGGWRQAGLLAAAGIYAITHQFPRMHIDHENAKRLAEGLGALGFKITRKPETNMVWFDTESRGLTPDAIQAVLAENGVRISGGRNAGECRWVVHHQVPKEAVEHILKVLEDNFGIAAVSAQSA
ncbi:Threonine aldolase [Physocladia obscura]|uniref:Threonine aldolase n=1 Tax=Physocladia obscura TaxID=109957 RepID=A0AAD5T927_9FUNG|nr:Threonine aldolase [Physocladia obscura]